MLSPASTTEVKFESELEIDFLEKTEQTAIINSARTIFDDPTSRSSVWPAFGMLDSKVVKPRLRIVPLERIGVSQGKSGSKVRVAYFVDGPQSTDKDRWSLPLVIKVAPNAELVKEKNNADGLQSYVTQHRQRFALPFLLSEDKISDVSILWSQFTASTKLSEHEAPSFWLRGADLLGVLRGKKQDLPDVKPEVIVTDALELVRPLHQKGLGAPEPRPDNIVAHYNRYLRGILTKQSEWPAEPEDWCSKWKAVWASPDVENISQFGSPWKNPFWVLDQLCRIPNQQLQCGYVHGDLHPRNVVLTGYGEARIIDFGWAGAGRHISQDFVLLDCNLRFVVQHPDLPIEDLRALAGWIAFDQNSVPVLSTPTAKQRFDLLKILRSAAQKRFHKDTNWDIEYVVPLFLTALGLLKHMSNCENQISAHLTILALADYIAKNVLPKLSGVTSTKHV